MFKVIIFCGVVAGALMFSSIKDVCAQESEPAPMQEEYDLIIGEALDQIEKNLDPVAQEDEVFLEPVILGAPEPEPEAHVSMESDRLEEIVEPSVEPPPVEPPVEIQEAEAEDLPQQVEAQDAIGNIEEISAENVEQVQLDEQANSIVVTDTSSKVGEIGESIARLDRVNKEILIRTKILQIVLNDEHPQGVDWEAIVSDYQKWAFSGLAVGAGAKNGGSLSLGSVSREDYDILLEALDTVGVIRTVLEGSVRTENGATRVVEVPYSKEIRFPLTPAMGQDEMLTVSVSEGVTVQVENGATVVIGSLFEDVMVESISKIPLLGDLPLLGFVFRNQGEESRKAETITFLTVKTVEKE